MRALILPAAVEDILRGYEFYEGIRIGLGQEFENSILDDISGLERHAGIHRRVLGYHRMLATRFPYAVYYRIEDAEARVRAVLDCRRDPSWIEKKLNC